MRIFSKLEPTVSSAVFYGYLEAAIQMGVNREELIKASGTTEAALAAPDGRLPFSAFTSIRQVLERYFGPAYGLKVAETMTELKATVLAYMLANSNSLSDAFTIFSRYRSISAEMEAPKLNIVGDNATFGCRYGKLNVMMNASFLEAALGFWLVRGRYYTGVEWNPIEVQLQGPTTDRVVYERVFRCKVVNRCKETKLIFDKQLLDLPIRNPDPNLLHYLTPIAEEVVKNLPGTQSIKQLIQDKIFNSLESGNTSIDSIADQLHVSARTLQRRLEDQGTSFAELLDQTRQVAAIEYLKDPRISITETAFLLGFSDTSTFYRAFKRWTKQTPAQFRKAL